PFGGVDGREDKIIFIEQRHPSLVAGRVRWVERQLREKALTRRIAARDLFELYQVGMSRFGVFVDPLQMRLIPEPGAFDIGRPIRMADVRNRRDKHFPVATGARRAWRVAKRRDWVDAVCDMIEHALG